MIHGWKRSDALSELPLTHTHTGRFVAHEVPELQTELSRLANNDGEAWIP